MGGQKLTGPFRVHCWIKSGSLRSSSGIGLMRLDHCYECHAYCPLANGSQLGSTEAHPVCSMRRFFALLGRDPLDPSLYLCFTLVLSPVMAPLTKRCNCTSHGCNGQEIGYNQYRQHQKEDKRIQEVEKEACDLKKKPRMEEHIVSLIL